MNVHTTFSANVHTICECSHDVQCKRIPYVNVHTTFIPYVYVHTAFSANFHTICERSHDVQCERAYQMQMESCRVYNLITIVQYPWPAGDTFKNVNKEEMR